MSEKRILTTKCPSCNTSLQIKTRSVEKTVICPKCQASLTVSAPPSTGAAADALPRRADASTLAWQDEPQPLPFAEPASLPFAEPIVSSGGGRQRVVGIVAGISAAAALLAVGIIVAMRAGGGLDPGKPEAVSQHDSGKGASEFVPVDGGESGQGQPGFVQPQEQQSLPNHAAVQAAKTRVDRAAARIASLERQKRDWLLAYAGRQGASGKKVIVWPNERLLDEARRELAMAQNEYEQSK
jgi:hypothetical protein